MTCTGKNSCTHHTQALKYIKESRPEHLVLWGSCCNVRGLLGAAPRVTVIGQDVDKLVTMADHGEADRLQILATAKPSLSLSSDPGDMVYLCENADTLRDEDFAELAAITRPGGCMILSATYYQGNAPQQVQQGRALAQWVSTLKGAGFSKTEPIAEETLVYSSTPSGEFIFSVSQGLIRAEKGGSES